MQLSYLKPIGFLPFVFGMALILQSVVSWAEGRDIPTPSTSDVFRNTIKSLIPEQPVSLEGEWSDEEMNILIEALRQTAHLRQSVTLGVDDILLYGHSLSFKHSDRFLSEEVVLFFDNPASFFGGGESGEITTVLSIPRNASLEPLTEFLSANLPTRYVRDPDTLAPYSAMVGRAICSSLLSPFKIFNFGKKR